MERLETMLTGGHPNSLGRTVEVVETVIADRSRLTELLDCYRSDDPVVRLRTSNALKRLEAQRHDWLMPFLDRLIDEVGALDQASAQWTMAQLFLRYSPDLSPDQRVRATALLKGYLEHGQDWIVLNATMETLSRWAEQDAGLRKWLAIHLRRLADDPRKSVAQRAKKLMARMPAR
jgi:hypothetical protein